MRPRPFLGAVSCAAKHGIVLLLTKEKKRPGIKGIFVLFICAWFDLK
jgi:hypothetical protein